MYRPICDINYEISADISVLTYWYRQYRYWWNSTDMPTLLTFLICFWAHLCCLHSGLICAAFCLSVVWTGPKLGENDSYLRKYSTDSYLRLSYDMCISQGGLTAGVKLHFYCKALQNIIVIDFSAIYSKCNHLTLPWICEQHWFIKLTQTFLICTFLVHIFWIPKLGNAISEMNLEITWDIFSEFMSEFISGVQVLRWIRRWSPNPSQKSSPDSSLKLHFQASVFEGTVQCCTTSVSGHKTKNVATSTTKRMPLMKSFRWFYNNI